MTLLTEPPLVPGGMYKIATTTNFGVTFPLTPPGGFGFGFSSEMHGPIWPLPWHSRKPFRPSEVTQGRGPLSTHFARTSTPIDTTNKQNTAERTRAPALLDDCVIVSLLLMNRLGDL